MLDRTHSREQITSFLRELEKQTDRGVAVIAASVLDELFRMVLIARFVELGGKRKEALFDKIGAPLLSLSAKIEIALAVGVIDNKSRLAAHFIRDIRNKFAHRIDALSFEHPEVIEIIEKRADPAVKQAFATNRGRFLGTFRMLAAGLYGTLIVDIRIHSLEESHQEQAHWMKFAALQYAVQLFGPLTTPEVS
jgi:hypothetical protein